jgi:hypothetical protein
MTKYTVVGFYEDNSQPYIAHVTASTPTRAASKAKSKAVKGTCGSTRLCVVDVFVGHHRGHKANRRNEVGK